MSTGKINWATLVALGVLLGACASQPNLPQINPATDAEAVALLPASEEARAAADRADPLTRANFWAREHTKTPENLATTLSFIDALAGIGSYDRLLEVASQTLPIHPHSVPLLTAVGRAQIRLDRPGRAKQAFQQASDLDPANVAALAGLGSAYDRLGQHDLAQPAYRRALALEPERISTLSNLGMSLMLSGKLDEAAHYLDIAAGLPGASVQVRQNLALIQGLQGNFDAARKTASLDAPEAVVERNLNTLRRLTLPTRTWDDLGAFDEVPEEAAPRPITGLRGALSSDDGLK